jgi:reactive intermediate/imine deaminase
MKKLLFFTLLLLSIIGCKESIDPIVNFINPSSVSTPRGYSHSAIIDLGNCKMVILSGQVPVDNQGNLVGEGDFNKQTEQVFLNIKNVITEAGGTMDNIVKLNIYLTDVSLIQTFRDIRNKFVNPENPPAATLVQVTSLFRSEVMIEIEATAIIPKR